VWEGTGGLLYAVLVLCIVVLCIVVLCMSCVDTCVWCVSCGKCVCTHAEVKKYRTSPKGGGTSID